MSFYGCGFIRAGPLRETACTDDGDREKRRRLEAQAVAALEEALLTMRIPPGLEGLVPEPPEDEPEEEEIVEEEQDPEILFPDERIFYTPLCQL